MLKNKIIVLVLFLNWITPLFAKTLDEIDELKWRYTELGQIWIDNIFSEKYCSSNILAFKGCFAAADCYVKTLNPKLRLELVNAEGTTYLTVATVSPGSTGPINYFQYKNPSEEKIFWHRERARYSQIDKVNFKELVPNLLSIYEGLKKTSKALRPFEVARILNASSIYSYDVFTKYEPSNRYNGLPQTYTSAVIGIALTHQTKGYPLVSFVLKGSPAFDKGIRWGDKILKIDGQDLLSASDDQTGALLSKNEGEKIELILERQGNKFKIDLASARPNASWLYSKRIMDQGRSFTYLALQDFDIDEPEVLEACQKLESELIEAKARSKGLILDLRGNPGGNTSMAQCLVGLLTKPGLPMMKIKDLYNDSNDEIIKTGPLATVASGLPLVVLQDFQTASAAEIVAGNLRLYGRSINLGTRTMGKGLVQIHNQIGRVLHIQTVFANFLPNGESPHLRGVSPHFEVLRGEKENELEADPLRMEDVGLIPAKIGNEIPILTKKSTELIFPKACIEKQDIKKRWGSVPHSDPLQDLQVMTGLAVLSCLQK